MNDAFCFDAEFDDVFYAVCGWAAFWSTTPQFVFVGSFNRVAINGDRLRERLEELTRDNPQIAAFQAKLATFSGRKSASTETAAAFAHFLNSGDAALKNALDDALRPGWTYWNGAETARSEADFDRFLARATGAFDRAAAANSGSAVERAARLAAALTRVERGELEDAFRVLESFSKKSATNDESGRALDDETDFARKLRLNWNTRDLLAGLNGEPSTREFLTEQRRFFQERQNDSRFDERERLRAGLLALAVGTLLFFGDDLKRAWDALIGAARDNSDELDRAAFDVCEALDSADFDVDDESVDFDDFDVVVEEEESQFAEDEDEEVWNDEEDEEEEDWNNEEDEEEVWNDEEDEEEDWNDDEEDDEEEDWNDDEEDEEEEVWNDDEDDDEEEEDWNDDEEDEEEEVWNDDEEDEDDDEEEDWNDDEEDWENRKRRF